MQAENKLGRRKFIGAAAITIAASKLDVIPFLGATDGGERFEGQLGHKHIVWASQTNRSRRSEHRLCGSRTG
jgi:hypothetical protein